MDIARRVRGIDADQPRKRAGIDAVLVLGDETEPDLHKQRQKYDNDAERPQRRVADPAPAAPKIRKHSLWTAHESREARGGAADEAPQQAKDEQGQDRTARPDVPVGVMVVDRPPAERDQAREQPVNQPYRRVPDGLS